VTETILYNFHRGRYSVALFSVWLGFSCRRVRPYRVLDFGYIKVMWMPRGTFIRRMRQ
jgi:hypothetical protein